MFTARKWEITQNWTGEFKELLNFSREVTKKCRVNSKGYPRAEGDYQRKGRFGKGILSPRLGFRSHWKRYGFIPLDGEVEWTLWTTLVHRCQITGNYLLSGSQAS